MDGPTVTALAAAVAAAVALGNGYRQDRRAQFTHMITILSQLDSRFEGDEFRRKRARAAKWVLAGSLPDDVGGQEAAKDVLNFFETLAFLHRREAIDADAIWHYFASWLLPYYYAFEPLRVRSQRTDPNSYREFGALADAVFQVEREKRDYKGQEQVTSNENIAVVLRAESLLT